MLTQPLCWSRTSTRAPFSAVGDDPRDLSVGPLPSRGGGQGEHLKLPCPRAVLGHAIPVVVEAVVVPLALFYLVLMTAGFRWALLAALGWSYWLSDEEFEEVSASRRCC